MGTCDQSGVPKQAESRDQSETSNQTESRDQSETHKQPVSSKQTEAYNNYSPLALSYLGDAVIEIMARSRLVRAKNLAPETLHAAALGFVKASSQRAAADLILPMLTEDELAIYKRGRNAKVRVPKSATHADYHAATALECLFGWLYLKGESERLDELFCAGFAPREALREAVNSE